MHPVLVSGTSFVSGSIFCEYGNLIATIREMNDVEQAFENLRTKLNEMNLEHAQHSVFPQVFGLVETMIGPLIDDDKMEEQFVESMQMTMQSVIPDKRIQIGIS